MKPQNLTINGEVFDDLRLRFDEALLDFQANGQTARGGSLECLNYVHVIIKLPETS